MWRSRLDGTERTQLTFSPMRAHQPHWSPDGTHIAFMASQPGKPWQIYLISAAGGPAEVQTEEKINEGDLSWLPDGRLVFGRMPWMEYGNSADSAVHILDVKTHAVSALPNSDGLFSPRVSPDGRYLAAFSVDSKKLLLYNLATRKTSQLATGQFAYLNWSKDGHFIYLEDYEHGDDIVRINVPDGRVQHLVSAKEVPRGSDPWSSWLGVAPDDSPIVMRDQSTEE